jgi:hypothetical protein
VFAGIVTAIQSYLKGEEGLCVDVTLQVLATWKGETEAFESITISTASNDGLCGYDFELEKKYLVYTKATDESTCGTQQEREDLLSRTKSTAEAQDDWESLANITRPPSNVTPPPTEDGQCSFTKQCCVEDCCFAGTIWNPTISRCVCDDTGLAQGFDGTHSYGYDPDL